MSTRYAHYMNACKEMTIWNVSAAVAAKNDWNGKRQIYFAFNDFRSKKIFARYPEVPGIPFQLARRSKLVFLFPHELI
ncbi:hypothetical protein BKC07_17925 [Peribacillus simplex]|nr:hypothetical protein BKC07_17925 [Peribacillus simplex]